MADKILVTGGAGFIGSNLVEALVKRGDEVIVIDKLLRGNKIPRDILPHVNLIEEDVRDFDAIDNASKGCKHIYHLAALLGVDIVADNPVETMEVETIGLRNVATASIKNGVKKLIYASTSGIYGHSAIEKSVTEDITVDPRTSYAIAKRYNELYLAALYEEKNLDSVSIRFFNVYGKSQDARMVIPRFIEQATKNQPLTVFAKGKQTRDFTYIDDTIKSTILLANTSGAQGVFNVAKGEEMNILELAKMIKNLTNSSSEINLVETSKKRYDFEVERRIGDSSKLKQCVNYKPETILREGLKRTYDL